MNQLLSIVPLETLAGWPAAPDPSPLVSLGLLVGIPAVGALVIIALVNVRAKLVGDYGAQMHASAWAGDHPEATIAAGVPPTAIDTSPAEGPARDDGSADSGAPTTPGADRAAAQAADKTGGASAKW